MIRHSRTPLMEIVLVVVALALVVAIMMPATSPMRRKAKATTCMANLKAQGNILAIASSSNGGKFPETKVPLSSHCEQGLDFRAAVMGSVPSSYSERIFYCGANSDQDPAKLWTTGAVSTWGYVWMNERGPGGGLPAVSPPLRYVERVTMLRSHASVILAADVTVTDRAMPPFDFAPRHAAVPFRTSHDITKGQSEVNVLYADGHVDTVKLNMKTATPLAQPGGGWFWLPN